MVVSGLAKVTRDEDILTLRENSRPTSRSAASTGWRTLATPLHLIEVQSGGYLGEDDIVRLEDTYGRR